MTRDRLGLPRPWSMQAHLIAIACAIGLLAWVAGVAVVSQAAAREAQTLHDRELMQVARLLLGLSAHELEEIGPTAPIAARILVGQAESRDTLGDDFRYQVWSADGHLQLGNFGLPSAAAMAKLGASGYSWLQMDGDLWRVYALHAPQSRQEIQVAERAVLRQWSIGTLDKSLLWLVPASLLVVLLPGLWALRRLLRPVRDLAAALQLRSPAHLAPLDFESAPRELAPVVAAVNTLFRRLTVAMQRERDFTALAAHELRTPLATVRVLAEAAGSAGDEAGRSPASEDLTRAVDRCSHMLDQLLTLSRLDVMNPGDMNTQVDMTEVVMEALSDVLPQARLRKTKLVSHLDGSTITGDRFGVLTLLRNLLSNAVRYTPQDGRIEIVTSSEGDDVIVRVDDSGPGIPASERERVFERFERLHRNQDTGVGLGLSIVRTVIEAHGASVALQDSPLGGLRVVVTFVRRAVQGQVLAPQASPGLALDLAG